MRFIAMSTISILRSVTGITDARLSLNTPLSESISKVINEIAVRCKAGFA